MTVVFFFFKEDHRTTTDLSNSREEIFQVSGSNSCSELHAENCARVPLLWREIVNWLSEKEKKKTATVSGCEKTGRLIFRKYEMSFIKVSLQQ